MSVEEHKHAIQTETPATASVADKAAKMIDDPVDSVILGIAFPTAAVSVVIGGIYGLSLVA
jgi:hypothetical protein